MNALSAKDVLLHPQCGDESDIKEALAVALAALDFQIPLKPVWKDADFGDKTLSCPHCSNPVTNYWVKGAKPAHCQFCGQALDWSVK